MATSALPSQGPKVGWNGYITPACPGSPMLSTGRKSERAQIQATWLHNPCLLAVHGTGRKSEVATSPLPSQGLDVGGMATLPMPARGSSMLSTGEKLRSGYFTAAFPRAQTWAEWLHNPCLLKGPQWSLMRAPSAP